MSTGSYKYSTSPASSLLIQTIYLSMRFKAKLIDLSQGLSKKNPLPDSLLHQFNSKGKDDVEIIFNSEYILSENIKFNFNGIQYKLFIQLKLFD